MAEGSAPARAALAGNPSDGYGGAVLAVTLDSMAARVVAEPAGSVIVEPASPLVEAAARRLGVAARLRWTTTVPRSVGLGGSSALVIATLRAFRDMDPAELAELALAVEVEDLGIAAGPQDRYAQAYGGLTFMDFGGRQAKCESLETALLPPLVVAWHEGASEDSGVVHDRLRNDFDVDGMRRLADAAREARAALLVGDRRTFARAVDVSFDERRELMALDPRHVEMIAAARAAGASANYTGSGGAIVAVCEDGEHRARVEGAMTAIGCETVTFDPPRGSWD